jgi:hypothetical protein
MFGLTKNRARAGQIRTALQSAEADLSQARSSLGAAIADEDAATAAAARDEVARLEQRASELRAALPIAEQRAREAAAREAAQRQAEANKAANASRKRRLAAATKVDRAIVALGQAYDEYTATEPGTNEARLALARRAGWSLRSAMAHHALPVARALDMQSVPPTAHRRPLAEAESGLLREFPE